MTNRTAINQLKNMWSRVGLNDIPKLEETVDVLAPSGRSQVRKKSDRTAQMNLRIRHEEKRRVALIAVRENVSINEIFSRMLALYEREHGKVELTPTKPDGRE
jgi:hypothetical protein